MKTKLWFAVCAVMAISACKKESTTNSGSTNNGVYVRRVINPPAGYTFPRTFTFTYETKDFNMYANAAKLNPPDRTPEEIWEGFSSSSLFNKIILVNNKTITFVDSEDEEESAEYYFTQDSLIIKYPVGNGFEEIAFAKGGYNGFETTGSAVYYAYMNDNGGGGVSSEISTPGFADLAYALKVAELNSINDLKATDTLAFANNYYKFR